MAQTLGTRGSSKSSSGPPKRGAQTQMWGLRRILPAPTALCRGKWCRQRISSDAPKHEFAGRRSRFRRYDVITSKALPNLGTQGTFGSALWRPRPVDRVRRRDRSPKGSKAADCPQFLDSALSFRNRFLRTRGADANSGRRDAAGTNDEVCSSATGPSFFAVFREGMRNLREHIRERDFALSRTRALRSLHVDLRVPPALVFRNTVMPRIYSGPKMSRCRAS
jgi:hypothetical protein